MKKFFLSMLMVISVLGFTATAGAWHFEVEYYGNGWFDSSEQNFYMDDGMGVMADAWWEANPSENPGGGIDVTYDINPGWGDMYDSMGHVEFQIVSDFGKIEPQPVDVWFHGEADAYEWVDYMGNPMWLDGTAMANVWVWSDFGFELYPWGYFDELIELESNTLYMVDTEIWLEAWAVAEQPGPDWFESWDEYYDYFVDGEWGEIWAESEGWFVFDAEIITAEVPIPGALWLLGSGLIALVGIRKRR